MLLNDGIIEKNGDGLKANWGLLNANVARLGKESNPLNANFAHLGKKSRLRARWLSRNLKEALEQRELAHAFRVLFKYYPAEGHLFRTISVSDLIVFHVIMSLEGRQYQASSVDAKYQSFVTAILEDRARTIDGIQRALNRSKIAGLQDFYDNLHGERDDKAQRRLVAAFGYVHGLANRVKERVKCVHPREYTSLLQDFGNNLRRCGDPLDATSPIAPEWSCVLARDVARVIRLLHTAHSAAFFIVDSLRNPFEIICLRQEFANCFVMSLYADKGIRSERVRAAIADDAEGALSPEEKLAIFEEADRRDSGKDITTAEESLYKQNVPKCVQLSDIAINNGLCVASAGCRMTLANRLLRPLCLILEPGCTRPTEDETFMNEAYTIAVKSNCISRQVGAVVIGPKGYIVGAGWNDVGRGLISCGLRAIADLEGDWCPSLVAAINPGGQSPEQLVSAVAQEYAPGLPEDQAKQCWFCFKDVMANRSQRPKLLESLRRRVDALQCEPEKKEELQEWCRELFNGVLDDVKIHQLEFCLALHAEENAILQGARIGGMGLRGGKIYTTAEPCTLCSKKIHQVGLKEVIYTEPYPKSLREVYMPGVDVRQFEGVKPRAYIRLFMPHHDRKDWQELAVRGLIPDM